MESSVIRSADKIIGTNLPSLYSIYVERTATRIDTIMNDTNHPANVYFNYLQTNPHQFVLLHIFTYFYIFSIYVYMFLLHSLFKEQEERLIFIV